MSGAGSPSDEKADDLKRRAREIAERSRDIWTLSHAGFVERYMQGDAYLAIRRIGEGRYNHGFLLEAVPVHDGDDVAGKSLKTYTSWNHDRVEQTAVFPGQVQLMEGAKHVVPSRIWPQIFDDVLIDLGKPLYVFVGAAFDVQKVGLSFPDGEVRTPRSWVAVACGESASKEVKAAADTMDDRSNFRIDDGVERFDIDKAVELFSGLRIGIDKYGIWPTLPPPDDSLLQHWQLGIGPIDSSYNI